jgi:hypothetical protein
VVGVPRLVIVGSPTLRVHGAHTLSGYAPTGVARGFSPKRSGRPASSGEVRSRGPPRKFRGP